MRFLWGTLQERYVVVEVTPSGDNVFFLSLNRDKVLTCDRVIRLASQRDINRLLRFSRGVNRIVAIDPSLASTLFEPFRYTFDDREKPIQSHEFENAVAQTLERVFPQRRKEVSEELAVDELDVILIQGRARSLTLDKRETHYPPGQSGKLLEGTVELLCTTRTVFERLSPFFEHKDQIFFVGIGSAELQCLSKVISPPFGVLTCADFHESGIAFMLGNGPSAVPQRTTFTAHPRQAIASLANQWSVSYPAARSIYYSYLAGAVSPHVTRELHALFLPHERNLRNECVSHCIRGSLYLHTFDPFPFSLPVRARGALCVSLPVGDIIEKFGFSISPEQLPVSLEYFFRIFAPFVECHYDKSDPRLHRDLMRRIHWIYPRT